ncbi:DUF4145 domain-containing protein [Pseudomonas viridiflava]|uniref:DUF4145 domain-containing protein n=1 Tax=Pseudomonas viridiflava TaxID=33069 RepID=UPI000F02D596|nr:DUF4145 domain-containing protein [Pseudomonas viridiflava]
MSSNWKCPYCSHYATLNSQNYSSHIHGFNHGNYLDKSLGVEVLVVVCPNDECKQISINAGLFEVFRQNGVWNTFESAIEDWNLLPSSLAIPFPEYIPKAIRDDYEEACKIRDLSPKASATLSRRCLQGIIRDFKGITKKRLVDEIDALRDDVDPDTWAAIDAVRTIGNIGAHMEKDINEIIDVDPDEAQLLIELIETLIKDWYVARHKRQEHLQKIKAAAESKK